MWLKLSKIETTIYTEPTLTPPISEERKSD
jgi:hypothetical protein